MASKYYYYVTCNDEEPGPGVGPIDEDGKYFEPDGVGKLTGQNLKLARKLRRLLDVRWGPDFEAIILRFNRKTHKFVGVVK